MILKRSFSYSLLLTIFFYLILSVQTPKAETLEKIILSDESKETSMDLKNAKINITRNSKHLNITIKSKYGTIYKSKAIPDTPVIILNDDTIFFTRYNKKKTEIIQINPEFTQEKIIKTFEKKYYPKDKYDINIFLKHAGKNTLYYSLINLDVENKNGYASYNMYQLNLKDGKINTVAENTDREKFSKNRMIYFKSSNDYGPMNLYSVKLDGKNNKKLKDKVLNFQIINNKLYYVASKKAEGDYYVFKANTDFSKIEKISKKIKTKPSETLNIAKITDKKVYYEAYDPSNGMPDYHYVIDLKTKEMEEIDRSFWDNP